MATSVIKIDALLFLDANGGRFFVKYFDQELGAQPQKTLLALEKRLWEHFGQVVEEMKEKPDRIPDF